MAIALTGYTTWVLAWYSQGTPRGYSQGTHSGPCRLGAALYLLARKAVPDVSDETRAEGLRRSCVANICIYAYIVL